MGGVAIVGVKTWKDLGSPVLLEKSAPEKTIVPFKSVSINVHAPILSTAKSVYVSKLSSKIVFCAYKKFKLKDNN